MTLVTVRCLAGPSVQLQANNREQWQADVVHVPQLAVQRRLIADRSGKKRPAVRFQSEPQPPEPVLPYTIQMALDSDLLDRRPVGRRVVTPLKAAG